jgi:hypothetical protein
MKTVFTISGFKRPMMTLFTAVSLLAACKKDHNDSHVAPVTTPLSVVAAKAGDTIRIQGTNFTTDVNQVKVLFNGVPGTVVSASDTEIMVVVPEGATTGNVTVTVYENTVQAGSLTINPLTLYSEKVTEGTNFDSYQLISLNAATLAESVIFNLNEVYDGASMQDIVYLPTTNEVVGLDRYGWTLIKINVATKQKTTFELTKEYNISFDELVPDNANNLYAMKEEGTMPNSKYTLVKLDPATGNVTALKPWVYAYGLTYLPSGNQIVGMNMAARLTKYNLATGDTSTLQLSDGTIEYHDLFKDNKSTLYALKTNYNTKVSTIVKLDPVTLAETVVTTLSTYDALDEVNYIPQRNEFVGIWKDQSFYRFNLGTNQSSVTALTTDPKIMYGYAESN